MSYHSNFTHHNIETMIRAFLIRTGCGILICILLVGLAYIHEISATHSEGFIALGMTLAILGLPLTYFVETILAETLPIIY